MEIHLDKKDNKVSPRESAYFNSSCNYETCMKPIIHVLNILGVRIIYTNSTGAKYRCICFGIIYSLLIYAAVIYCSVMHVYKFLKYMPYQESFIIKVFLCSIMLNTIFTAIVPIISWMETKHHIQYINDWKRLQACYYKTTNTKLHLQIQKTNLLLSITLVFYFITIAILEYNILYYDFQGGIYLCILGFYIYLLRSIYTLNWYSSCLLLSKTAEQMLSSFYKELEAKSSPVQTIYKFRPLWLELSTLAQKFGNNFGYTYCSCILYMFSVLTIDIYIIIVALSMRKYEVLSAFIPPSVTTSMCLFIIGNSGQDTYYKIQDAMKQAFMNIEKNVTDGLLERTISGFLRRMDSCPAAITLCDFVTVNRRLVVSLGAMVVTYIIVLVQLDMATSGSSLKGPSLIETPCNDNETDCRNLVNSD